MIVSRDIFQLKFGMAREARTLLEEGKELNERLGRVITRVLTDFTGPSYRMILETEFESLADYEERLTSTMAHPEWQQWYRKFVPLVESSYREILRTVSI